MVKEILIKKTGEEVTECLILKWRVDVGEAVKEGDLILEVEADKVAMEIQAPSDGILLCRYFEEGEVVPTDTIIAYIGDEGDPVPAQS